MGGDNQKPAEQREAPVAAPSREAERPEQEIARTEGMQRLTTMRACAAGHEAGLRVRECAENEKSRLPSAVREQQRNNSALEEARKANPEFRGELYSTPALEEGKMQRSQYGVPLDFAINTLVTNGSVEKERVYDYLVSYASNLKSDPQQLKELISSLDMMLYSGYSPEGKAPRAGDQLGLLNNVIMGEGGTRLLCGDISAFMVRFLDDLGYEAVSMGGVEKGIGHYATMVKLSPNEYFLVGVTRNSAGITVRANTMEQAMKEAFRIAPSFVTSGILEIHGKDRNEFYQKYALAQEALFSDRADQNADRNLRFDPSVLEGANFLTPEQRESINKHLSSAQNSGLRVTGVTFYAVGEIGVQGLASGSRIAFEGFSVDGGRRTVLFDMMSSRDENRMAVLWRTLRVTTVDTVSVEIGERHLTGGSELFDRSQSSGARVEASRKTHYDSNTYGVMTGYLSTELTSGGSSSLAGDKSSNIVTFVPDLSYRLVRTSGGQEGGPKVDFWVGVGAHGLITVADTQDRVRAGFITPEYEAVNTRDVTAVFGTRLRQSGGAMWTGNEGRLAYRGALEFSLLQDRSEVDQGNQRISATMGVEGKAEAGFVYRVGDGADIYGNGYMTILRMPVFEKTMYGGTLGVSLLDLAGVQGLDVTAYVSGKGAEENVTMSSLNESWRDEAAMVYGGKIHYTVDSQRIGVGMSRYNIADSARGGGVQSGNQLSVDYAMMF